MQGRIQAWKQRTFELLKVREGAHLLDVGCGTGDDVQVLAQLIGNSGHVVSVDRSETMITEARKRAEGLQLPIEYKISDAQHLGFPDNTFDGCRAERVFQQVDNPRQVLAEMVRVTRPGGWIVVLDPDFETLILDVEDRALTHKLLNFHCDHKVRNGWIGRQLLRFFREAGLTDLGIETNVYPLTDYTLAMQLIQLQDTAELAQTAGVMSATEVAAWFEELERASQAGRFFGAMTFFFVSGRKP